jgi:hypothetical protein
MVMVNRYNVVETKTGKIVNTILLDDGVQYETAPGTKLIPEVAGIGECLDENDQVIKKVVVEEVIDPTITGE